MAEYDLPDPPESLFEGFAAIASRTSVATLLAAARDLPSDGPTLIERSLGDPNGFRSRVEDSCRLTPDEVERTVTIHYSNAGDYDSTQRVVVCLVRPVKGRVLRGFQARGRTGACLRVLGLRERRELVLHSLLELLDEVASLLTMQERERRLVERALAHAVLCEPTIDSRRRRREFEDHVVAALGSLIRSEDGLDTDSEPTGRLLRLAAIAASRDPVLVEVNREDSGRITYTQLDLYGPRKTSEGTACERRWESLRGTMSRALGAIPNKVYLPTYKLGFAAEYLLEVRVPYGNYIGSTAKDAAKVYSSRGIGTHRVMMTPPMADSADSNATQMHIPVTIHQRPSEAVLRSMALALLVTGISVAVLISASRFEDNIRDTTALEVLSWSTGIVSIAFVAVWAVVRQKSDAMAFELGAISSAITSAAVLASLVAILAASPNAHEWILWPLVASAINLAFILGAFVRRLRSLWAILAADSAIDLEGPQI